jgi:hypothetical protein
VLGGPSPQTLVTVDSTAPRTGFETQIQIHSQPQYFEVQALDSHGHVLATSGPHRDRAQAAAAGH